MPVEKKKKAKSGLREGFSVILGNPRIRNLALLVVGYGVSHRLFEFAWKGQLRVLYPSPLEYQGMLSNVSMAQGVLSIIMMVVGRWVFRQLGWVRATPLLACFLPSIPTAAAPRRWQFQVRGLEFWIWTRRKETASKTDVTILYWHEPITLLQLLSLRYRRSLQRSISLAVRANQTNTRLLDSSGVGCWRAEVGWRDWCSMWRRRRHPCSCW